MTNEAFKQVGKNLQEKATVIWNIANHLAGPFKPHEYGLVILPMTVVKRFHDCLLPYYDEMQAKYEQVKHFEVIDGFMCKASHYFTTPASSRLRSCWLIPGILNPTSRHI